MNFADKLSCRFAPGVRSIGGLGGRGAAFAGGESTRAAKRFPSAANVIELDTRRMEHPKGLRADELRQQIKTLESRDLQLWSMGLLILLIIAAGFLGLALPNLMWKLKTLQVDGRYLPQLFFGFLALIVLFNIYAIEQRRDLHTTRDELIRELVRAEAAEGLSLVDPLTEIFNRRYLDQLLVKETSRADRLGTDLTFMMIDVDNFKSVNTRFGHLVGDRVLSEVALLMKKTFRSSDTVVRYGGDEFLAVMAETNMTQGARAGQRLQEQVDRWNQDNRIEDYKMSLSYGLASFTKGANVAEIIESADKKMYEHKARQITA